MNFLRNVLALIGFISLIGLLFVVFNLQPALKVADTFDEKALDVYSQFFAKAFSSNSAIDALVHKVRVQPGISAAELERSIKSIADELNIKNVGELALSKQVEAMSGKPYRYVKIYMLCTAMTAANMLNYNDAFSSFLPCRVSVVEDEHGVFWLYTMNLDLIIHGGKPIPPVLKTELMSVRDALNEIMNRSAVGDF